MARSDARVYAAKAEVAVDPNPNVVPHAEPRMNLARLKLILNTKGRTHLVQHPSSAASKSRNEASFSVGVCAEAETPHFPHAIRKIDVAFLHIQLYLPLISE